jgi:hypothetical protein
MSAASEVMATNRRAEIDDAFSFTPKDQPQALAEAIAEFCAARG